jgi:hypothetical protein
MAKLNDHLYVVHVLFESKKTCLCFPEYLQNHMSDTNDSFTQYGETRLGEE